MTNCVIACLFAYGENALGVAWGRTVAWDDDHTVWIAYGENATQPPLPAPVS